MRYPLRTHEHIKETISIKALLRSIPDHWILRHLTERDYGLDCLIEIPIKAKNGYELAGDIIGIQLKYDKNVKWVEDTNHKEKATISKIETSNAFYWFSLPFPVFLCIYDEGIGNLYFAPIKLQVRKQYELLASQDSMSFFITRESCFNTTGGLQLLLCFYAMELAYFSLAYTVKDFLTSYEKYGEFIMEHLNRDVFLELDFIDEVMLFELYRKCRTILDYRMINADLPTQREILEYERTCFPDSSHLRIHENTAAWALKRLAPIFINILETEISSIIKSEESYWENTEPLLYRAYLVDWMQAGISTYLVDRLRRAIQMVTV